MANRHGAPIPSTSPRGPHIDHHSSLVAAWPRSPARQAGPTEIRDCTRAPKLIVVQLCNVVERGTLSRLMNIDSRMLITAERDGN